MCRFFRSLWWLQSSIDSLFYTFMVNLSLPTCFTETLSLIFFSCDLGAWFFFKLKWAYWFCIFYLFILSLLIIDRHCWHVHTTQPLSLAVLKINSLNGVVFSLLFWYFVNYTCLFLQLITIICLQEKNVGFPYYLGMSFVSIQACLLCNFPYAVFANALVA